MDEVAIGSTVTGSAHPRGRHDRVVDGDCGKIEEERSPRVAGVHPLNGTPGELFHDKDIDVVYVGTPHNFHFSNVQEAIKNGKAVLCEKPITVNPHECKKLIELSIKHHVFLMEAMWTYFLPSIQVAKRWIDEGKIGKIRYLSADFGFKVSYEPQSRLFNPKLAGGALLDIGIYPIALAWLVFEEIPQSVDVNAKISETRVDTEETMNFKYADDTSAKLTASFECDLPNEAVIMGEDGYIRIPDFFMTRECYLYKNDKMIKHFEDERASIGYNYEIEEVNNCLKNNSLESQIMTLNNSLKIQEMIHLVKSKF